MKSRLFKIVLIVATLLLFTACEEATPTPTLVAKATPGIETVICPPGYLAAPVLTGPAPEAMVDTLTPLLTWEYPDVPYPDASSTTLCVPEQYQLEILRGPFFTENIGSLLPGIPQASPPVRLPREGNTCGVLSHYQKEPWGLHRCTGFCTPARDATLHPCWHRS